MKKTMAQCLLMFCAAGHAVAQGFDADPVFKVRLLPDRAPLVAGEELRLAISLTVNTGWHINSDEPGDEFSLPTTVEFLLPDGWPVPVVSFPDGKSLDFDFSDTPIEVWEDRAVILAGLVVPGTAVCRCDGGASRQFLETGEPGALQGGRGEIARIGRVVGSGFEVSPPPPGRSFPGRARSQPHTLRLPAHPDHHRFLHAADQGPRG
jgi:hypothetical protein